MAHHGVAALSNAELLAILIGSGNTEDSAVELMRKILSDYHNNLNELGKCSIDDLCHYKGIGPAKAISILAASELGKRRKEEEVKERKKYSVLVMFINILSFDVRFAYGRVLGAVAQPGFKSDRQGKNKCRWIGCYCCGYSLYLERGIDEAGCFDGTLS